MEAVWIVDELPRLVNPIKEQRVGTDQIHESSDAVRVFRFGKKSKNPLRGH